MHNTEKHFNKFLWDNYFWFECITSVIAILSIIAILLSVLATIWYDYWYWRVGLTSSLVLLSNNWFYQAIRLYIYRHKYL